MNLVHQLLLTIWILASLGYNTPESTLHSTQHVSTEAKYMNVVGNVSHRTSLKLRDGTVNVSKEITITRNQNLSDISPKQSVNPLLRYKPHFYLGSEEARNVNLVSELRLKRTAKSHSVKKVTGPNRHEKQKKSNHIAPKERKLDDIEAEIKIPKRIKQSKRRQFDIQLPFPNFSVEEPASFDFNHTESNNGLVTHDGDDYVLNVFDDNRSSTANVTERKTKEKKHVKKVRVPLPFPNSPHRHSSKGRKKDIEQLDSVSASPLSNRRQRKQKKKRLPPLH